MRVEPNIETSATSQAIDVDERVHHIVLTATGPITTFSPNTYGEIHDGLLHANSDERVDCVVITSEGPSFAAGGDLSMLWSLLNEGDPTAGIVRAERAFSRIPFRVALRSPKPVICVIDGACMGGGLILALASDVVIATSNATFVVAEAKVGIFDPYVAELLPRVVGLTRARHMAVTADTVDAVTAERWGIVSELTDDRASAIHRLQAIVAKIRRASPTARGLYKRAMTAGIAATDNFEVMRVAMSDNGREGMQAFLEKRPPAWRPLSVERLD